MYTEHVYLIVYIYIYIDAVDLWTMTVVGSGDHVKG